MSKREERYWKKLNKNNEKAAKDIENMQQRCILKEKYC